MHSYGCNIVRFLLLAVEMAHLLWGEVAIFGSLDIIMLKL